MKAIIPAAGKGTRLLPHTYAIPKPLVHVAGKPIIGHILDSLIKCGINSVGFILNDNGDQITDYVRLNYNLNVDSIYQDQPNGLGYAVYLYLKDKKIDDSVLIVLGDTIIESDLSSVLNSQYSTIAVHNVNEPQKFGIVELENGFIKRLVEKPENPISNLAIIGFYFIKNPSLLLNCLEEMITNDIRTKNEYQLTDALQMMLEK
ncbi:MAG: nucleotidyltransferase family protein, partial [Chloroflexi bacterium]|nr:nucleotidyltransferase family protein [Chloroflexota bacterium]